MKTWKEHDALFEGGPRSAVRGAWWWVGAFVITLIGLAVVGHVAGWFGEAAAVAQREFGPSAVLVKYEWFKDAAAQLDKKQADIRVYESRLKSQDRSFNGVAAKDWPRDAREQRAVWESEVAGVIASFNGLAADYNAQMAKFNWRFANAGDLPAGAATPLPRDFKPYSEEF